LNYLDLRGNPLFTLNNALGRNFNNFLAPDSYIGFDTGMS